MPDPDPSMTAPRIALTIAWMYPDSLSTYGDRGNVLVLTQRARWRGYRVDVVPVSARDPLPKGTDIVVVGGGQDNAQSSAGKSLRDVHGQAILDALDDGAALLAVCAGLQLLGREYRTASGERIDGIGLFDLETVASGERLVGDVRLETRWGPVFGFENHSGRTYLGDGVTPFGTVVDGHGNNGRDRTEGVVVGRAIGTYLHGPLLPGNPAVADWLLAQAVSRHTGADRSDSDEVTLPELPDGYESALRSRRMQRA